MVLAPVPGSRKLAGRVVSSQEKESRKRQGITLAEGRKSDECALGIRVKSKMSCGPQQLDRVESTERAAPSWGVLDLGVVFSGGCPGLAAIYPLFLASHADPSMPPSTNDNPCLLWL